MVAVPITTGRTPAELRALARRERDGRVSARLLALANALDGMSRDRAARAAGMDRQTLRDWVHRYNAEGVEGLRDRPRAGLVADPELAVLAGQPLEQLPHGLGPVRDLAVEPTLARAPRLGHRDRDPRLVRIQPDAHRPILVHGSSPMPGARRRRSGATPAEGHDQGRAASPPARDMRSSRTAAGRGRPPRRARCRRSGRAA